MSARECGQRTKGVTNYTLLDEIEGWRSKQNELVRLVTFNYDTMIEQALPSVGVKIAAMHDYISQRYALIKHHGSVNWEGLCAMFM